ncbi:neuronal acetylcholine receptor subunit alpha-5-like [Neocloeon triangulifer]|uniref:neuronal acetylcholine receptor subunit alpha-5-like n=1 Tax=Neocloeon triangulifer TaxID=2078957 RepID=UPI00286F80FA|nr:neuronal acetylcholine receptor subunit alpha-5-like [Neocloeon triangulifer]
MFSKFEMIFLLLCSLVDAGLCVDCSKNPSDSAKPEHKLRYQLFCKGEYDPLVRPVKNHEDNITVRVFLNLKFFSVDEDSNKFMMHSWVITKWFDADLTWTPLEHNGIDQLVVSSSAIWLPDLAIFNSDMSQTMLYSSTDCTVESTGEVKCAPDLQAPVYCDMKLQKWPYDTQKCSLYISTWVNTGNLVDVVIHQKGFRDFELMQNGNWELFNRTAHREANIGPQNLSYPYLQFDFELRRHAALYSASVIGPAFALAALMMSTFLMKSLAIRCVICCTGLICDTLFLQYVVWNLPANGDTSPTIVSFYRDTLILNLAAMAIAIITDQMRSAGDGGCADLCGGQAPKWLVGAATFVRGRGGKAGQLILGVQIPQPEEISPRVSEKGGIPQCETFATFVDRSSLLALGIVQIFMLITLVP